MSLKFPAFQTATLRRPEWAMAGDVALATWIRLCCLCSEYENGGTFGGAESWDDRAWLQISNVTKAGVDAAVAAKLCRWDGDSLVVMGYDNACERKVKKLRKNGGYGKLGGRPNKPSRVINVKPSGLANQNPISSHFTSPHSTSVPSEEDSSEPPPATSEPPPLIAFPVVGDPKQPEWGFTPAELAKLKAGYPSLDVLAEARKALVWVQANPAHRKTARGMLAYLARWMAKAADRPGGSGLIGIPGGGAPKQAPESFAARDVREKEEARLRRVREEALEREIAAIVAKQPTPREQFEAERRAGGAK